MRSLGLWWSQGPGSEPPARFLDRLLSAVDIYRTLGVLDALEGERWAERLRIAVADSGDVLSDAPIDPAPYLEAALGAVQGAPDVEELHHLNSIFHAFLALNVIAAERLRDWWLERLIPRMTSAATSARSRLDPAPRQPEAAPAPSPDPVLRCVIPGPPDRPRGLRVTSLELYDDAVRVQWHFTDQTASWPQKDGTIELSDDVGTAYHGPGGGASRVDRTVGGVPVIRGADLFTPAAPPQVRTMNVAYRGEAIAVPLR